MEHRERGLIQMARAILVVYGVGAIDLKRYSSEKHSKEVPEAIKVSRVYSIDLKKCTVHLLQFSIVLFPSTQAVKTPILIAYLVAKQATQKTNKPAIVIEFNHWELAEFFLTLV